ncbi:MAG: hypothetical protein WD646_13600 [Actinomycetota bacterium]
MRRRRVAVICAVALGAAVVVSPGTGRASIAPASVSDGTGPLDTAADLGAALALEERLLDHFHYGQPFAQRYNTPERNAGDIETLVGEPDAGLYTGAYLASQSYRYVLARQELADAEPGDEHDFWSGQLAQAKDHIDQMVAKYHMLINISREWQTTFDPKINSDRDILDPGYIDFGGGIFPGEPGLLFRVCNPVDAPPHLSLARYTTKVTLPWEDGKTYHCMGSTSRDQYAGATHGLTTVLNLVGPHDAHLRNQVAGDLMKMTDYALKYLWFQPRPHGEVVIPELGGNDLEGFISPLFVYTPMAQMNMLQVARNAARVAGTDFQRARYEALWLAELATELPQLAASQLIDNTSPHDAYYKFHLNHLTGDNLIRLEPDPNVRAMLRHAFGVMDSSTGDDQNALFEAITYGLTGQPARLDAGVTHHRQWLDYRAHSDAVGNIIDYTAECGTTFQCVPTDQLDVMQNVADTTELVVPLPGSDPKLRATEPIPVGLRRPADFMWQKDPTIIIGCGGGVVPDCNAEEAARWEGDGVDFLQTYWMIRYFTEVAPPPLEPFPPWLGPTFR